MSAVGDVAIKARLVGTMSSNDDWASSFLGGQLRLSDITTKLQKRLTGMEQTTIICKQASKQASKQADSRLISYPLQHFLSRDAEKFPFHHIYSMAKGGVQNGEV